MKLRGMYERAPTDEPRGGPFSGIIFPATPSTGAILLIALRVIANSVRWRLQSGFSRAYWAGSTPLPRRRERVGLGCCGSAAKQRTGQLQSPTLIVGSGGVGERIAAAARRPSPSWGLRPIGFSSTTRPSRGARGGRTGLSDLGHDRRPGPGSFPAHGHSACDRRLRGGPPTDRLITLMRELGRRNGRRGFGRFRACSRRLASRIRCGSTSAGSRCFRSQPKRSPVAGNSSVKYRA